MITVYMKSDIVSKCPSKKVREQEESGEIYLAVQGNGMPNVPDSGEIQVAIKISIPGSIFSRSDLELELLVTKLDLSTILLRQDLFYHFWFQFLEMFVK